MVELVVASVHLPRDTANNTFYIFSSLKYFETAKTYSLDSAMNCVLLLPILVFAVLIYSADAARFPHFFVIWSSGNLWKKESFANFSAYQNFICEWMVNFFRAPEPGFLNAFQQPASVFRARRQQQQQPGVLGCLTPCTRELRVFVNLVIIQQISLVLITVDIKYCLSSTCPCFHQPFSILSTFHNEKGISEL